MRCIPKRLHSFWVWATLLVNLLGGNMIMLHFGTPARSDGAVHSVFAINVWFSIVATALLLGGLYRIKPGRSEFRAGGLGVVCTVLVPIVSISAMCMVGVLMEGAILSALVVVPLISIMTTLLMLPILLPLMVANAMLFAMYHRRELQGKDTLAA